ncbi:hypothetical protein EV05_1936 [Prochlorococcus sp. MIT 0601]|nr:hypothetical protein EV05_1936 [Prochlorococcus sp. MIT 0601]
MTPAAFASEKDFKVKDTCARYYAAQFTAKQALKRLGLKNMRGSKLPDYEYVYQYCQVYLGGGLSGGTLLD